MEYTNKQLLPIGSTGTYINPIAAIQKIDQWDRNTPEWKKKQQIEGICFGLIAIGIIGALAINQD